MVCMLCQQAHCQPFTDPPTHPSTHQYHPTFFCAGSRLVTDVLFDGRNMVELTHPYIK